MLEYDRHEAVCCLLMAAYRLTMEQVLALPHGVAEKWACQRVAVQDFENGLKDFITIVLTTPLFTAGEDSLRLDLLKIAQLMPLRAWQTAIFASDEEFANARPKCAYLRSLSEPSRRENWPDLEVIQLLRETARKESQTENARSVWLQDPSEYTDPKHQQLFASIIKTMRKKQSMQCGSSFEKVDEYATVGARVEAASKPARRGWRAVWHRLRKGGDKWG